MTEEMTENMRLQADLAMANERAVALEKEINVLQTKLISGDQLIQAQALRASGKTKKEIADLVGVDHQQLAELLKGVDGILNKVTAGLVDVKHLEDVNKQIAETTAVLNIRTDQLNDLGKANQDLAAEVQRLGGSVGLKAANPIDAPVVEDSVQPST